MKIASIAGWLEEGASAADAHAVAGVGLGDREADDALAVQVLADRIADLSRGVQDIRGDGRLPREALNVQRPARRVVLLAHTVYLRVVLRAEEVGQDLR